MQSFSIEVCLLDIGLNLKKQKTKKIPNLPSAVDMTIQLLPLENSLKKHDF